MVKMIHGKDPLSGAEIDVERSEDDVVEIEGRTREFKQSYQAHFGHAPGERELERWYEEGMPEFVQD